MKSWVKFWALRFGLGAACLVIVINMVMQTSIAVTVGRAVVTGFVIYLGTLFLGGMVGNALMVLVAEQAAAREEKKKSEVVEEEPEEIDESVARLAAEAARGSKAAG